MWYWKGTWNVAIWKIICVKTDHFQVEAVDMLYTSSVRPLNQALTHLCSYMYKYILKVYKKRHGSGSKSPFIFFVN